MHKIILPILCICLVIISCKSTQVAQTTQVSAPKVEIQGPKMEWDKTMVDFGKVVKGEKRETSYTFTNVGNESLIIDIATSCHCTTLDYPQGIEIAPGEGGVFNLNFDSTEKEKSGVVDVTIVLKNEDKNGYPIIEELFFKYELVEKE